MTDATKEFYRTHADTIWSKRFDAPEPIRRHAHRTQYAALLDALGEGSVLDAGCGEGVIPILLAQRGRASVGVDLSEPNIEAATRLAAE
ncbi:class I SAM-dependent methyltransferase, partial [Candidatus Uhrbacteria bacterium]|nr:class I SAM-dependent methyltransferase [Candidatus Uhrbacteria bacterium]